MTKSILRFPSPYLLTHVQFFFVSHATNSRLRRRINLRKWKYEKKVLILQNVLVMICIIFLVNNEIMFQLTMKSFQTSKQKIFDSKWDASIIIFFWHGIFSMITFQYFVNALYVMHFYDFFKFVRSREIFTCMFFLRIYDLLSLFHINALSFVIFHFTITLCISYMNVLRVSQILNVFVLNSSVFYFYFL